MTEKQNMFGLMPNELRDAITRAGMPKFVSNQVLNWMYKNDVIDPAKMTNISIAHRNELASRFDWLPFPTYEVLPSKDDLAVKIISKLSDGYSIESVVLREKSYNTLCVSSQSGCPVACQFCLTGYAGFKRNLSAAEIVAQVMLARHLGYPISHMVYMGMGEPLLNFDNVFKSIDILCDPETVNISRRKITVSTSGIKAGIQRLIDTDRNINLAFSVGNPNPLKRVHLMPIEKRNPIIEVARMLNDYQRKHNRKLTLEYTLLEGVNDGEDEIRELANLSKFLDAKINLINLNPHINIPFRPVSAKRLGDFKDQLLRLGSAVTVRFRKGQDIAAACGQLGESLINTPSQK